MPWDENYTSATGLTMGFNHTRPRILPTSRINLSIRYDPTGYTHIDVQVQTVCTDPPEALSEPNRQTVKWLLTHLRGDASRAISDRKTASAQEGIVYVIQALQVRLNQHWHAVCAGKEVSLEELLGVLTVEDDAVAEEKVRVLMESLRVCDDEEMTQPGEGRDVVVHDDGDDDDDGEVRKAIENDVAAADDDEMET